MVYPAVNAFAADEPGKLAPALAEMNNFVNQGSDSNELDESPSRSSPGRKSTLYIQPPLSSNTVLVTPEARITGSLSRLGGSGPAPSSPHKMSRLVPSSPGVSRAEEPAQGSQPFVDTMELRPEQFRIVTPNHGRNSVDRSDSAFAYAALPLPYAQRKRLSDCLFAMSKEQTMLTDECAVVLREARESDLWDLAVAELITQVIVVLYCPEDDFRLLGLRHYLLGLGIAC